LGNCADERACPLGLGHRTKRVGKEDDVRATALKKVRKTLDFKVLLQSKAIQRKLILLFFILYVLIAIYDKAIFLF
jgi:hypothetical protein